MFYILTRTGYITFQYYRKDKDTVTLPLKLEKVFISSKETNLFTLVLGQLEVATEIKLALYNVA